MNVKPECEHMQFFQSDKILGFSSSANLLLQAASKFIQ